MEKSVAEVENGLIDGWLLLRGIVTVPGIGLFLVISAESIDVVILLGLFEHLPLAYQHLGILFSEHVDYVLQVVRHLLQLSHLRLYLLAAWLATHLVHHLPLRFVEVTLHLFVYLAYLAIYLLVTGRWTRIALIIHRSLPSNLMGRLLFGFDAVLATRPLYCVAARLSHTSYWQSAALNVLSYRIRTLLGQ